MHCITWGDLVSFLLQLAWYMNITLTSVNKEDHLLIVSAGGITSKEELFEQSRLVYEEITKYGHKKILVDDTATRFPQQIFLYIDLVEFYSSFPPEIKFLKIACVLSPEYKEMGALWETIAVNRCFDYHAFISFQKGFDWLIQ